MPRVDKRKLQAEGSEEELRRRLKAGQFRQHKGVSSPHGDPVTAH